MCSLFKDGKPLLKVSGYLVCRKEIINKSKNKGNNEITVDHNCIYMVI
jgi:hypothetical protein